MRESYKLDAIGELELGERKIDFQGMDLATLSDVDWDKFIDYNIQDVQQHWGNSTQNFRCWTQSLIQKLAY